MLLFRLILPFIICLGGLFLADSKPETLFSVNIIYVLVALVTVGLPSLLLGLLLYIARTWWANACVLLILNLSNAATLFLLLFVLSFPSMLLVGIFLQNSYPGMEHAIGYSLLSYLGSSIFWGPVLLAWSCWLQRIMQREAGVI
ncbi:hypothetical protein [Motilimonas eburnea]|uniref:hypothetical protein n=1 Tax=Motilimonas eburnea TaxID=1737488 RepID=UPI001E4D595A|nr:hypothetical protein [Motilimonas eburnea]MCE2571169.1 hypothetical protein [Motilimonas eburnea]